MFLMTECMIIFIWMTPSSMNKSLCREKEIMKCNHLCHFVSVLTNYLIYFFLGKKAFSEHHCFLGLSKILSRISLSSLIWNNTQNSVLKCSWISFLHPINNFKKWVKCTTVFLSDGKECVWSIVKLSRHSRQHWAAILFLLSRSTNLQISTQIA